MKTLNIPPSPHVEPELRQATEDSLRESETIDRPKIQSEFIKRGLFARAHAQTTGVYMSAEAVLYVLEQKLARAKESKNATR